MKDHHTISAPRETTSNDCSWEVDIYRKGVNEPVDSIIISDITLPPRKNKRGKIVWRLPVDKGILPSFGTDERRRILNLFKERKKIRRKVGSCVATREFVSNNKNTDTSSRSSHQKLPSQNIPDPSYKLRSTIPSKNNNFSDFNPKMECSGEKRCETLMTAKTALIRPVFNNHLNVPQDFEARSSLMRSSEFITSNCRSVIREKKNIKNTLKSYTPKKNDNLLSNPHVLDETTVSSNPPENFISLSSLENKIEAEITSEHGINTPLHEVSLLQNRILREEVSVGSSKKMRYISLQERCHQEHLYIASCLMLSHSKQEQLLNRSSFAVHSAKAFVSLYYPHVEDGRSVDLALYYTPHAQKSISIGGTHSVVTGKDDIVMQIASLAGTKFLVSGVVAQDAYDFFGSNILITGVAHTVSSSHSSGIKTFAHSISLIPVKIPHYYQIHSDALSLMS